MKEEAVTPPGRFDFVITLKSPQYKQINLISQLLLVMFLAVYFRYLFAIGFFGSHLWLLAIPVLIIGLWLWGWVQSSDPNYLVHYRVELMMAGMALILLPLFKYSTIFGVAFFVLGAVERWVKVPDEIGFSKEKIVRNSFPRKQYEWFEVDNAMIRHNLFTLDFRDNRIIQKELDEPIDPELEKEFNEFCKSQLLFNASE